MGKAELFGVYGLIVAAGLTATAEDPPVIRVATEDAKAARLTVFGIGAEGLVKRGTLTAGELKVDVYLPAGPYRLKNTNQSNASLKNTATRISIDANGDGRLTTDEAWFVNLPVRVGDAMYEVVGIAEDGSSIDLRASSSPLGGLIVGRRAAPFSYTTSDGKTVSLDDYKGRWLVLDFWGTT